MAQHSLHTTDRMGRHACGGPHHTCRQTQVHAGCTTATSESGVERHTADIHTYDGMTVQTYVVLETQADEGPSSRNSMGTARSEARRINNQGRRHPLAALCKQH